jgi:hypothetical protein
MGEVWDVRLKPEQREGLDSKRAESIEGFLRSLPAPVCPNHPDTPATVVVGEHLVCGDCWTVFLIFGSLEIHLETGPVIERNAPPEGFYSEGLVSLLGDIRKTPGDKE